MIDKSRAIQLLNDVSRIIAVGYIGLVAISLSGMLLNWAIFSSDHAKVPGVAVACVITWPIMAFLLGYRLWLWAVSVDMIYIFIFLLSSLGFLPSDLRPAFCELLLFLAALIIVGSALWALGIGGACLANYLGVDKQLNKCRYWWIAAVACAFLLIYANTAGQDAALNTVMKQLNSHDSKENYAVCTRLAIPVVWHGESQYYVLDPTGRIIITTGEYFD